MVNWFGRWLQRGGGRWFIFLDEWVDTWGEMKTPRRIFVEKLLVVLLDFLARLGGGLR